MGCHWDSLSLQGVDSTALAWWCRSRLCPRTLLLPLFLWHGHISAVPYSKGVGIRGNCNVWKSLYILLGGLRPAGREQSSGALTEGL